MNDMHLEEKGILPIRRKHIITTYRDTVLDIYSELGAALVQSLPSDDQIIMEHVRTAYEALGRMLK